MAHGGMGVFEPMALFLDVDGTLLEFADRPEDVRVPQDLPAALRAATAHLNGALALVSGRAIADLDMLFAPVRLAASGLHGGEFRATANAEPVRRGALPEHYAAKLRAMLAGYAGIVVEDKSMSIAVHYRAAPRQAAALQRMLQDFVTGTTAPGLELMQGELVFELKPPGFDKGTAIRSFMQAAPFAGRRPVFVADHPIDQAAFETVAALNGLGISVGRPLPGAAAWFSRPAAVRAWLQTLT
jgi:trehalose 6-phosphate phosphatase